MKRLETAVSLVQACETLCDIGCDHGYAIKMIAEKNLVKTIFALDISAASLAKSQKNLQGIANIRFVVCDGFSGIENVDYALICGLGGLKMIEILKNNKSKFLILQPQNNVSTVRAWLIKNGYKIEEDRLSEENGKYYDIFKVTKGSQELSQMQLLWGKDYQVKNELLLKRILKEEKKYKSFPDSEFNKYMLESITEVKKCQQ